VLQATEPESVLLQKEISEKISHGQRMSMWICENGVMDSEVRMNAECRRSRESEAQGPSCGLQSGRWGSQDWVSQTCRRWFPIVYKCAVAQSGPNVIFSKAVRFDAHEQCDKMARNRSGLPEIKANQGKSSPRAGDFFETVGGN
jgi:hypothetical protein